MWEVLGNPAWIMCLTYHPKSLDYCAVISIADITEQRPSRSFVLWIHCYVSCSIYNGEKKIIEVPLLFLVTQSQKVVMIFILFIYNLYLSKRNYFRFLFIYIYLLV